MANLANSNNKPSSLPTLTSGKEFAKLTGNAGGAAAAATASSSKTTSSAPSNLISFLHSMIPPQIDVKQVFLGMGIATFAMAAGFAGYHYVHKYKVFEKSRDQTVGMTIELSPGRHVFRGSADSPPEGVLILHQCPRGRRVPSIAPYPLKLETFLRVHGIKYEVDFNCMEPRNDESPWITLDLEDVCDSQNCIRFICERYNLDPDAHIEEEQKTLGRAFNHLLENHLYWGIALWRWVYDGARHLNDIQLLPPKSMGMIPNVCRTVEQAAWFHGIGKKKPRDVVESILLDLGSLSTFLADKTYFLNEEKPSELDCTAFSLLAQMLWNMDGSPYHQALIDNYPNLTSFCQRMRENYWPDWELCLNNDSVPDAESSGLLLH